MITFHSVAVQRHVGRGVFVKDTDTSCLVSGHIKKGETVAVFPGHMIIYSETARRDLELGEQLERLIDRKQKMNRNHMLVIFLALQKTLGEKSRWKDWIAMLPETVDLPWQYSSDALAELKGTPMHRAATGLQQEMADIWKMAQSDIKCMCKVVCLCRIHFLSA